MYLRLVASFPMDLLVPGVGTLYAFVNAWPFGHSPRDDSFLNWGGCNGGPGFARLGLGWGPFGDLPAMTGDGGGVVHFVVGTGRGVTAARPVVPTLSAAGGSARLLFGCSFCIKVRVSIILGSGFPRSTGARGIGRFSRFPSTSLLLKLPYITIDVQIWRKLHIW